jgi:hypothetical protein
MFKSKFSAGVTYDYMIDEQQYKVYRFWSMGDYTVIQRCDKDNYHMSVNVSHKMRGKLTFLENPVHCQAGTLIMYLDYRDVAVICPILRHHKTSSRS